MTVQKLRNKLGTKVVNKLTSVLIDPSGRKIMKT